MVMRVARASVLFTRTRRGVVPYSYSVDACLCVSNRVGRKMNDFRMNDEVDEQRDEMD